MVTGCLVPISALNREDEECEYEEYSTQYEVQKVCRKIVKRAE